MRKKWLFVDHRQVPRAFCVTWTVLGSMGLQEQATITVLRGTVDEPFELVLRAVCDLPPRHEGACDGPLRVTWQFARTCNYDGSEIATSGSAPTEDGDARAAAAPWNPCDLLNPGKNVSMRCSWNYL